MAISTNPKPVIYRNLYENTASGGAGPKYTADPSDYIPARSHFL